MIKVTCPSCAKEYNLKKTTSNKKRKVRCTKCKHVWEIESETSQDINTKNEEQKTPKENPDEIKQEAQQDNENEDNTLIEGQIASTALKSPKRAQNRFFNKKKKNAHYNKAPFKIWQGITLSLFAMLILLLIPLRTHLVTLQPDLASLYEKIGYEINIYGLEIQNIKLNEKIEGKKKTLFITGNIVNITSKEQTLLPLSISLKTRQNFNVYTLKKNFETSILQPNQRENFEANIINPPQNAHKIDIRFHKD